MTTFYSSVQAAKAIEPKVGRFVPVARVLKWVKKNGGMREGQAVKIPEERLGELAEYLKEIDRRYPKQGEPKPDPEPHEIYAMAAELRKKSPREPQGYPSSEYHADTPDIHIHAKRMNGRDLLG